MFYQFYLFNTLFFWRAKQFPHKALKTSEEFINWLLPRAIWQNFIFPRWSGKSIATLLPYQFRCHGEICFVFSFLMYIIFPWLENKFFLKASLIVSFEYCSNIIRYFALVEMQIITIAVRDLSTSRDLFWAGIQNS